MDTLLGHGGGAGFIGSNVVRAALAAKPWRVVVLDALTYAGHRESLADLEADPRYAFVQGDIADPAAVADTFARFDPRYVLHLAAESHVDRSIDGPREFVRTNVVGTHEMLVGARTHAERLPAAERARFRFVHVSTDEVFGSLGAEGRFDERSPHAPRSPYAASKAAADHLAAAYKETYGLAVVVTNCSNNYGPYQFPGEADPADDAQRAGGEAAPRLRRRPPGPRLAPRRGPRARVAPRARAGPRGRTLSLRRRRGAHEPRGRRGDLRLARTAAAPAPAVRATSTSSAT